MGPDEETAQVVQSSVAAAHSFVDAPQSFGTVWIAEEEPLRGVLSISRGSDIGAATTAVVAFIDGVQVALQTGEGTDLPALLDVGAGEHRELRYSIAPDDIPSGASSLFIGQGRADVGSDHGGYAYTILKGSAVFGDRTELDKSLYERRDYEPKLSAERGPFQALIGPLETESDWDGSLPADMWISVPEEDKCAGGLPFTYRIVALLDWVQVPLGQLGIDSWVTLSSSESLFVQNSFTDLPNDGEPHLLQIWALGGDGRFFEGPFGEATPWYSPFIGRMAFARWGPDSD